MPAGLTTIQYKDATGTTKSGLAGSDGSNTTTGVTAFDQTGVPIAIATSTLQTAGNSSLSTIAGAAGTAIAQEGTDATGVTQLSGGAGIRGWLSGIYSKLAGTLTVSAASLPLPTGAATAALQGTGNTSLGSIVTALGSTLTVQNAAGTNNIGAVTLAIGSSNVSSTVPVPITSTAYASLKTNVSNTAGAYTYTAPGMILGGVQTLTNVFRTAGGTALFSGVDVLVKYNTIANISTLPIDILVFDALPVGTYTDQATFNLNASDFSKLVGIAQITTSWASLGTGGSIGSCSPITKIIKNNEAGTSLYLLPVLRSAYTFSSGTTDVTLLTRLAPQ